jgi:hypothetical protein
MVSNIAAREEKFGIAARKKTEQSQAGKRTKQRCIIIVQPRKISHQASQSQATFVFVPFRRFPLCPCADVHFLIRTGGVGSLIGGKGGCGLFLALGVGW